VFQDFLKKKRPEAESAVEVVYRWMYGGYAQMVPVQVQVQKQAPKVKQPERPQVMLLDEVDVFFSDSFYGQPYRWEKVQVKGHGVT
jgi:hypothetical protein